MILLASALIIKQIDGISSAGVSARLAEKEVPEMSRKNRLFALTLSSIDLLKCSQAKN
jgi:recombinational DNA repair protein (RecF pathway)